MARTYSLVVPYSVQLRPQHDGGEDGEEQRLRDQEEEQHDRRGRRVGAAVAPLVPDASHELVHGEIHGVDRYGGYVELEWENKQCIFCYSMRLILIP